MQATTRPFSSKNSLVERSTTNPPPSNTFRDRGIINFRQGCDPENPPPPVALHWAK